jgi:hypothetical protein
MNKNVQINRASVAEALTKVKNHCMCLRLEETEEHYFALYPDGYRLDGCRVSKKMGKARALNILHDKMEQHWEEDQL